MHRSGTSLVAGTLRAAGVDIGRSLYGAGPGNPRGHFEDWDFFHLHEEMLAAAGLTCFEASGPVPANGLKEKARAVAAAKAGSALWGWKDPRTCLFLELWHELLPDARYVFIYRHPLEVALSLGRRDTDSALRGDPTLALRAWEVYNRQLLDFCSRHAERCFLAQVPALTGDLSDFVARVAAKLDLPLRTAGLSRRFRRDELARRPSRDDQPWERVMPAALELYRELEARADLRSRQPAPEDAEPASADTNEKREGDLLALAARLLYDALEMRAPGGALPALAAATAGLQAATAGLKEATARSEAQETARRELERDLREERAQVARLEQCYADEYRARVRSEADLAREARLRAELELILEQERDRYRETMATFSAHNGRLTQTLAAIEQSRVYSLVRTWWWLRRLPQAILKA